MIININVILPIAGYRTQVEYQSMGLMTLYSNARMQLEYYKKSLLSSKP